ncbi:MAG: tyrosine-type recombinase/integrase [Deltaproteobacteria bacterium]|nr:tyrosine-type recombinase/integrase [Deltaproteobacteria bacterium]
MRKDQANVHCKVLEEFEDHLTNTVGAAQKTRKMYLRYCQEFLRECIGEEILLGSVKWNFLNVASFIAGRGQSCGVQTMKCMTTALRSFFRFLEMKGWGEKRLVLAVPMIPHRRLSGVPEFISREQLDQFLGSLQHQSPHELRDYAVILCLARLGLRAHEIALMSIDAFKWRDGVVEIRSDKTTRTDLLPIPEDVGRAIVAYLKKGRPTTDIRRLFVRHKQPIGTPISGDAIRAIFRRRLRKSGIDLPGRGTHRFRHTLATHLVQQGTPLKQIADILRHRHLDTTVLYTKVNIPMLRKVALPWPCDEEVGR